MLAPYVAVPQRRAGRHKWALYQGVMKAIPALSLARSRAISMLFVDLDGGLIDNATDRHEPDRTYAAGYEIV